MRELYALVSDYYLSQGLNHDFWIKQLKLKVEEGFKMHVLSRNKLQFHNFRALQFGLAGTPQCPIFYIIYDVIQSNYLTIF
jgi:hypothetical protein